VHDAFGVGVVQRLTDLVGDLERDVQREAVALRFVDQPLDIVVGCEVVSRPVIREPMGVSPCFQITANDAAEADAIARMLRSGSKSCRAPTS